MSAESFESVRKIFVAGGPVMWPLLGVSILAATLIFERTLFWATTERPGRGRWIARLADRLRAGDVTGARALIASDGSVYGRFVTSLLDRGGGEPAAIELVETARHSFERFSTMLSTIITAAPLLGLLGTVTGIINSLEFLGARASGEGAAHVADPSLVATGLAQALVTTAFGLIIAIATVFPYSWFRSSADRCLGRLEGIVAAMASVEKRSVQPHATLVTGKGAAA